MKKKLLIIVLTIIAHMAFGQSPQGINYQAVARDSDGDVLMNENLTVRLSLNKLAVLLWQEEQQVVTNDLGMFSLVIGDEDATRTGGVFETFSGIIWEAGGISLALEIDDGSGYVSMGESQLMSVPYALYAESGPPSDGWALIDEIFKTDKAVEILSPAAQEDSPLFVVKNHLGNPVFAVFNDGVIVYVDEDAKGIKGGFAVGGYNTATKGLTQEFLRVTPDSVRVYVPDDIEPLKGVKGGFAVGGYNTASKGGQPYLEVTPEASAFHGSLIILGDLTAETLTETAVKRSISTDVSKSVETEMDITDLLDIIEEQQKQIEVLQDNVILITVLEKRIKELESKISGSIK